MTIQDAIKSGKPFRRPPKSKFEEGRYMTAPNAGMLEYEPKGKRKYGGVVAYLSRTSLLADDWEIRE